MEPTHFLFASKLSHPIHFDTPPSLRAVFRAQAQLSCLPMSKTLQNLQTPLLLVAGAVVSRGVVWKSTFSGVRIRRSPPLSGPETRR